MIVKGIESCKEVVAGIYKITAPDGKVYIGQSNNILRRIWNERCSGYEPNSLIELRRAMEKYGKNNFTYEVVEIIEDEDLRNEREIYYIKQYESTNPEKGYNLSNGGKGKYYFTEEMKQHLSEIKKGKPSNNKGKSRYFKVED